MSSWTEAPNLSAKFLRRIQSAFRNHSQRRQLLFTRMNSSKYRIFLIFGHAGCPRKRQSFVRQKAFHEDHIRRIAYPMSIMTKGSSKIRSCFFVSFENATAKSIFEKTTKECLLSNSLPNIYSITYRINNNIGTV